MSRRKTTREKTKLNNRLVEVDSVEGEVVGNLAQKDDRRVVKGTFFSDPLPPPDGFNKYPAEVQKAIVEDARTQMEHRHNIENKVVDSDSFVVRVGSIGTLIMYLLCITSAVYLLSTNKTLEGFVIGAAVGLAKSLVLFRSINNKSKETPASSNNKGDK